MFKPIRGIREIRGILFQEIRYNIPIFLNCISRHCTAVDRRNAPPGHLGVRQLAAAFNSLHTKRLCPKAQASLRTPNVLSEFE
jgi:hypothetical protein